MERLSKEFKSSLPTVEEIETELQKQEILSKARPKKTAPAGKVRKTKIRRTQG